MKTKDAERRVFYLTPEWKRLFAFIPLVVSPLPLIIILPAELTLWTMGPSRHLITLLLGIGMYLMYSLFSYFAFSVLTKPIRHIVTSEGITFCSFPYCISTPWCNIRGIGTSRLGIYRPQALLLQQPAVKGQIRDGTQLEKATIERRWLLTTRKDAPDDAIPLHFTVPVNWQESELGMIIPADPFTQWWFDQIWIGLAQFTVE